MGRANAILGTASVVLNVCFAMILLLQAERIRELDKEIDENAEPVPRPPRSGSAASEPLPVLPQKPLAASITVELPDKQRKIDRAWTGRTPDEVLLSDPRYRSLRLKGERNTLYRVHAEAITALRLSPDTSEKLLTLLAEHALEFVEPPSGKPRDDEGLEPRWRVERQLNEQRQQAEIEALIGTAKYREWREFYETKSARYEIALLEKQVEAIGEPLRSDQREILVDLIADEERQQSARPIIGPGVRESPVSVLESDAKRIEASNERLRQLAASYLTSEQLELFGRSLDRKLDWMRTRVDLERRYLEISKRQNY